MTTQHLPVGYIKPRLIKAGSPCILLGTIKREPVRVDCYVVATDNLHLLEKEYSDLREKWDYYQEFVKCHGADNITDLVRRNAGREEQDMSHTPEPWYVAHLDGLLQDAMRYRLLRDPCSRAENLIHYSRGDYGRGMYSSSALDKILDEAIAKAQREV